MKATGIFLAVKTLIYNGLNGVAANANALEKHNSQHYLGDEAGY